MCGGTDFDLRFFDMENIMKVGGTINAKETMTSLEVAELTGKEHKNVLRDIRNLLEQGVQQLNFEPSFIIKELNNGGSKEIPVFNLTKKGCLILASGYDALLREKIINRWEELELSNRQRLPQTFAEALRLAADQQEEIERQQKLLIQQKPKVEYFDALVDRGLNICFRDTAKEIGVRETEFIKFLLEHGYLYRDKKKRLKPFAEYVDSGLFVIKEYQSTNHAGNQTLVTPKGRETFRFLLSDKIEQNKQIS